MEDMSGINVKLFLTNIIKRGEMIFDKCHHDPAFGGRSDLKSVQRLLRPT
jgi:hypothetical protein